MSTYLHALGRWCFRFRRRVLTLWLVALVVLGGLAGGLQGGFDDAFEIPGTQSQEALDQLAMTFPEVSGTRATLLVLAPPGRTVDDPGMRAALERGFPDFTEVDGVDSVASPFDPMVSGMINGDRTAAIANVLLGLPSTEITDDHRAELIRATDRLERNLPEGSVVQIGGDAFSVEIPRMSPVELLGVAVALLVLLFTLGSVVAAGMPLVTALLGVAVSMTIMLIATGLTPISSTTPMLAVMLGLAVGIDYALFILSRHRDQLGDGVPAEESTARSVATAGSAVVFAGLTVVIALVGLSIAGIPFLGVMGIFAAVGVAFAVLIALTLLPALMGFAGERLRPRPRKRPRASGGSTEPKLLHGWSARWVGAVTKVPVLTVIVVTAALGVLSVPAKDLSLSLPNSGQHHVDAPDRITFDLVAEKFGPGYNAPLVVTADIIGSDDPLGLIEDLKREVEALPGVHSVPVATPNRNADTGFLQIVPETGPTDQGTKDLVGLLREKAPEWEERYDVRTAVTGVTAVQLDISDKLAGALLPFGIFVVGLSLVLLTMVFRSLWVPLKATVGYLLSVGAAFGATAMVFDYGWGNELINLEKPMPVISFYPILLMGILFGLAMDYEVFLVSRMREEYIHGRSALDAIRHGFVGSAKVVVAAAVIMVAVFAFFVPEGDGPIKPIAFGLAVGVAVDAFVVRMTLVPAVLALLGDRAWRLPRWLDTRLPSFDVEGEALTRVLALADWPGTDDVLCTENFGPSTGSGDPSTGSGDPSTGSGDLSTGSGNPSTGSGNPSTGSGNLVVDLRLAPGEVLVVEGPVPVRTPLLLALAGRLTAVEGKAKVAGLVLPEQAAAVRRRVAMFDGLDDPDLERALTDRRVRVIVIDGADAPASPRERDALAAILRSLPEGGNGTPPPALVLGVADTDAVAAIAVHGFHRIDLRSTETRSTVLATQES